MRHRFFEKYHLNFSLVTQEYADNERIEVALHIGYD
jgi:hypothetical protein